MGKLVILAFFIVGVGLVGGLMMQSVEKGRSGRVHDVAVETSANAQVTADAKVRRGPESWNFIYVALGFALTLESTIIPLFPFRFPYNLGIFVALAGLTIWLFICNGQFQHYLFALKETYENMAR